MTFGEDHCKDVWAPFGLSITTSVVTSLLTVITVPGNLLICIAILKDPNKELRTSFNYLLMNVAISDLLVGAITDPIFVLFHIREALGYQVITWIAVPHMSFFIGCTSSLLSIAMLAVERAVAVNATYHRKLPRKRAINMSIAIWIFSIAFPCIYFQIGYFKFAFIFSILMIIVTFVTLVTSFLRIHSNVRRHVSVKIPKIEEGPEPRRSTWSNNMQAKRLEYENRVTQIFKAILIFYAICNVPAFVFVFIVNLCESCDCYLIHWSRDLILLCVLTNCAGNQFLYAWRMRSFTRSFRSLIKLPVSETSMVVPQSTTNV
ncbi:hypothetical protein QZH41_017306 [Actinostola sp. cb2023]|nr:hypothetical protein QZH41_017306 [Actinostola sp. cb2023]